MKNTCVIIFLLALLFPCLLAAPGQEEAQGVQEAQVISEKAKIYLEASPFSTVIDTVQQGTVVALFPSSKKNKKWLYISYYSVKRDAQVTGFIKADSVEIFQENPEIQHEQTEEKTKPAKDEEDSLPVEVDWIKIEKETVEKEEASEVIKSKETKKEEEETGLPKTIMTEEIEKQKEEKIDENKAAIQILIEKGEGQVTEKEKTILEGEKVESRKLQKEGTESDIPRKKETLPLETDKKEEIIGNREDTPPQVLTKVSINVQMANIRLMPSLQSAVIHQVPSGVELKALAKTGKWYRVNLPPNEDGYVLSGYIHHSIVNEIFEPVQPVVEPEEPEEEPEIIEENLESVPEPEKGLEPPAKTEKKGFPFWIGGGAGYTLPSESHLGKGMSFGGTLGLEIMKYIAFEIRIPYFQSNVAEAFEGLSSGQLRNLALMLSMQVRYPLKDQFVPYLVGGGNYHLNKFSMNDGVKNSWNDLGFTIEESVDHSFGFHVGAGLDFFPLRNIALNVDIRYCTANLKGTWSIIDQSSQQEVSGPIEGMKLNSIQAGVCLKFFLGR